MGKRGFAHAGQILDQQVSTGQDASQCKFDLLFFTENHFPGLGDNGVYIGVHEWLYVGSVVIILLEY
jgi:hypothetical protein